MTEYQKINRPDLAILDTLWRCTDPITLAALYKHVCPHELWISIEALNDQVRVLTRDGHIARSFDPRGGLPVYAITCKGRVRIIGHDAESMVSEKPAPACTSMCSPRRAAEPPEEHEPAVALLCIDEDELDEWWYALDVEAKADAFAQWSLGNDGRNSHIYIEPHAAVSVPILGAAGETAEEWKAKAERLQQCLDEVSQPVKMALFDPSTVTDSDFAKLIRKHAKTILAVLREGEQRTAAPGGPNA